MAELVEFAGGDAGFDIGLDVVEDFGGQAAGDAHFFNVFGRLDGDAHEGLLGALGKGERIKDAPRFLKAEVLWWHTARVPQEVIDDDFALG
jgi:hypothetical protein